MDIMIGIIVVLSVLGLIALGSLNMILAKKERENLYKLIKSKSLTEYSIMAEEPEDKEEEVIQEIPVDEIPFLNEEK